jgi:hypothetical protein
MSETPDRDRELPYMPTTVPTCADVEERDLEAAYLARRLSEDDALAYEAHYFGCERCWASLRRASEVRAAFATSPAASSDASVSRTSGARRSRRPRTWELAAAAAIVITAGALVLVNREPAPTMTGTLRGFADTLSVAATTRGRALEVAWRSVAGARSYRVRLHAADGALLVEREISDTTLVIPSDSVRVPAAATRVFWQIHALDALRQPVARSPLTAGEMPAPAPR